MVYLPTLCVDILFLLYEVTKERLHAATLYAKEYVNTLWAVSYD